MKYRIITILISLFPVCTNAQEIQYVNYFYVKGDVCLPVRVKHSRGEFMVYSNGSRYDGPLDYVEAWDCRDRKIMDTTPKSGGGYNSDHRPIEYTYIFENLYPEEDTQEGYNGSSAGNGYSSGGSESWMDPVIRSVERGRKIPDPAYPNITFQAGISRIHGEFIRAKGCLGGRTGFIAYGGVGRDWIFNPKNPDFIGPNAKKKLAWHAGLGIYGGDLNGETATGEFAFMMDYAESPLVKNGSLNMWLEGTWYFGADGHFGAFGGLGCSMGDLKKSEGEKMTWNFIFEIGLAYRLF